MNTWPNNNRVALHQSEHEAWNANNYPGTLQLCVICEDTTGQCEEDSFYLNDIGPLCKGCYVKH